VKRTVLPLAATLAVAAFAADDSILIRDVTVHPVTSAAIEHGSVLITGGKIADVGVNVRAPESVRVVDGRGLHLYPGLINAATNVGLSEISALRDTVDLDEIGVFNPELRAEIAFNPSSEHIPVTRASGITTVLTLPGTGGGSGPGRDGQQNVIAGQAALMHLEGWTWEEMAVKPSVAMEMDFPQIRMVPAEYAAFVPGGARPYQEEEKAYHERLRAVSRFFEDARRYQKAKAAGAPDFRRDVKLEAMLPVIEGKQPLFVRAEKEKAIKDAVEFAEKEKVRLIIASPTELGSAGPLLKAHNIPVVLGKTLELPLRDDDSYDSRYTLPNEFYKAGVKFCFGTFDVDFARNVPFEAAQAAAFGLPSEEALRAVTINAAEIFGVADQVGSIEKGKIADLILTDGDPLETRTEIKRIFIAGRETSMQSRHTREYEKWSRRP
jgi:imidazolonepropionase-like amidohydrolase